MSRAPTIVLIEDSLNLRNLVLQILEIEHYQVLVAVDGEEGLKLVRETKPDLVLCDVTMPRMSGNEVLQALRADSTIATTPFIFLTAKAGATDLRAGMEQGADDYLIKPFGAEELLASVRTRLQKLETARAADERLSSDQLLSLPYEIRTPLSGIIGLAELLNDAKFSDAQRQPIVVSILSSARRLERSLKNFTLCFELELARHVPERAQYFVSQAPSPVLPSLQHAVEEKTKEYGRSVDLIVEPADLAVMMDAAWFEKAVSELLDNAVRFSPPTADVKVRAVSVGTHLHVEVEDGGVGMTTEHISRLQASEKLDRVQREQQGLGLGIPIARNLVELNGGRISLGPRNGGGMRATLILPGIPARPISN